MITAEELEAVLDLHDIAGQTLPQLRVTHFIVSECIQLLADYRGEIEAFLYDLLPKSGEPYVLKGYKPIVRKSGGSYEKWDGLAIRLRLAAQVADEVVDPDTGEYPPLHEVVAQAMTALAECAGTDNASQKWRVGQLRARGFKPSEFASWRQGDQKRITVVK